MTSRRRDVIALLALSLSGACAWSDPGNRPIWNAFEGRVVPAEGPWFYATLPVTVPVGFAAILGDTLVAHPLQVVDDAARDAGDLWSAGEMDFESEYYTQLGSLPLRAALTPAVFGGSWFFRSAFDIPPHEAELSEEERRAKEELERREDAARERADRARRLASFQQWLEAGAGRELKAPALREWDARLDEALRRALEGDAADRRALHVGMLRAELTTIGPYDALVALGDPDPVVRFAALERWPAVALIPPPLKAALREDPVESVRILAQQRFER